MTKIAFAPLTQTDDASWKEPELAAVLDLLWRKLEAIHQQEVTRAVARLSWTSKDTRAAIETLSIGILRTVFSGCSAMLLDSDVDQESPTRARMVVELFDLRPTATICSESGWYGPVGGGETRDG
jgi:glutamyl-tRNAGlu reductase-like protein